MPITSKAHEDSARQWAMCTISRGFCSDVFRVVLFATTASLFFYHTTAKHIPTSEQRRKNVDWTPFRAPDTGISLPNEEMLPVTKYANVKPIPRAEYERKIKSINKSEDILKMFLVDSYSVGSDVFIPRGKLHGLGMKSSGYSRYTPIPNHEDMEKIFKHEREVKEKTECAEPVPVVWNYEQYSEESGKLYFPSCTIYYRCRSDAGCCDHGHECQPTNVERITRYFLEMDVIVAYQSEESIAPSKVEKIVFDNHTACACKPVKQPVRCECPQNFKLLRPEANISECRCTCEETAREKDKACKPFQNGRKRLSKSDQRGIKAGTITPPQCRFGPYNRTAGRCPKKRERHLYTKKTGVSPTPAGRRVGQVGARVPEGSTPDNDELGNNQSGVARRGQVKLSKERRSILSLK